MSFADRHDERFDVSTWIEAIDAALPHEARVEELTIDSVEREGTRALLLGLVGKIARGTEHIGAAWSVTAASDLKEFARIVRAARSGRPVKPAIGPASIVVPERSAVLIAFPNDSAMPRLRTLMRPARLRALTEIGSSAPPAPQNARKRLHAALVPLAYRPARAVTARLLYQDGRSAVLRASVDRSAALAHGLLARASVAGVAVPRPLGHDDETHVFLEEHRSGDRLLDRLRRHDAAALAAETGRRLRALHALPFEGVADLASIDAAAEFAALDESVATLEAADPEIFALARGVRVALEDAWPATSESRPVLCHGAFGPGSVRCGPDGPVLIGLTAARVADPHKDVGSFLAALALAEATGRVDATVPPILRTAFVDGYGTRLVPSLRHEAAALLRLATRPYEMHRADWRNETMRLLERARACVAPR